MALSEQAAVAACQAGDLEAFDALYRTYVKPLYGFIAHRTLNRETAEDLTSVTFMKAMEKIGSYDPGKGAFAAWLYRIARNTITDHYRSRKDTHPIEDAWELPSDDRTDLIAGDRIAFEKLRQAINQLEPDKRDILLLRFWDGLSYAEIAQITGKSEGNCKVIVSRTLAGLRTVLPLTTLLLLLLPPLS